MYNLIKRTLVTIDEKEKKKITPSGNEKQSEEEPKSDVLVEDPKKAEDSLLNHPEVSLAKEKARSILEDARREAEKTRKEAESFLKTSQAQAEQKKTEALQQLKVKEQEIEKKWKTQFDNSIKSLQTLQQTLQKTKDDYIALGTQQLILLTKLTLEKILLITLSERDVEVFEAKISNILRRAVDYKRVIMRFNPQNMENFPPSLLLSVKSVLPHAEFRTDPNISPGGVIVETDYGTYDATIENQMQLLDSMISEVLEAGVGSIDQGISK